MSDLDSLTLPPSTHSPTYSPSSSLSSSISTCSFESVNKIIENLDNELQSDLQDLVQNPVRYKREVSQTKIIKNLFSQNGSVKSIPSEEILKVVQTYLISVTELEDSPWYSKHASISLSKEIIERTGSQSEKEFVDLLLKLSIKEIVSPEPRVRNIVGQLLGVISSIRGISVWPQVSEVLLESITNNFERQNEELPGTKVEKHTALQHDTEGWKSLETSMAALQAIVTGLGEKFNSILLENSMVLELIYQSTKHTNRFVREIGFVTLSVIFPISLPQTFEVLGSKMVEHLAKGLADNWSQVRYVASVATRKFVETCPNDIFLTYAHILIPRMALNRHYGAEGVRKFSQETWANYLRGQGKGLMITHRSETVTYYIESTGANNHAVREAACHCIAEFSTRIEPDIVRPEVNRLIEVLIVCFKDESWPVRDVACVALGCMVCSFPEEFTPHLPELFELWFNHLSDNILTVRKNTAVALGKVAKTFPHLIPKIIDSLSKLIRKAEEQPVESNLFGNLSNLTTFGVAKSMRDNDVKLHTDQERLSCGSMTSKAHQGKKEYHHHHHHHHQEDEESKTPFMSEWKGYSTDFKKSEAGEDHGLASSSDPWKATDGSVYLLSELTIIDPDQTEQFVPIIAEMTQVRMFGHFFNMLQSIWSQLPIIFQNLGKQRCQKYVSLFISPLFSTLETESSLAKSSAIGCLEFFNRTYPVGEEHNFQSLLTEEQKTIFLSEVESTK